jgi:alpha-methylacyl-CoA racemase
VLEKMGLGPEDVLLKLNPALVVGRMTGFRRDGKYKDMAGHDINYIAVAGVLSMMGRQGQTPYAPGNIIGDFAGGGAVCFMGILLALLQRQRTGKGQVVEANMVDGAAHMASFLRFNTKTPMWSGERGTNILDGGCPYYDTYETKDGRFMAVGPLEPQFFAALVKGLGFAPTKWAQTRYDRRTWPEMRATFTRLFKEKTRDEWERIYDGTDACCTPVLTQGELEKGGYDQRPIVTLKETPGFAIAKSSTSDRQPSEGQGTGVDGSGWTASGLRPGDGGEHILSQWAGWRRGRDYAVVDGGLAISNSEQKSKL